MVPVEREEGRKLHPAVAQLLVPAEARGRNVSKQVINLSDLATVTYEFPLKPQVSTPEQCQ